MGTDTRLHPTTFCDVTPCRLLAINQYFAGMHYLLQGG